MVTAKAKRGCWRPRVPKGILEAFKRETREGGVEKGKGGRAACWQPRARLTRRDGSVSFRLCKIREMKVGTKKSERRTDKAREKRKWVEKGPGKEEMREKGEEVEREWE